MPDNKPLSARTFIFLNITPEARVTYLEYSLDDVDVVLTGYFPPSARMTLIYLINNPTSHTISLSLVGAAHLGDNYVGVVSEYVTLFPESQSVLRIPLDVTSSAGSIDDLSIEVSAIARTKLFRLIEISVEKTVELI